MVEVGNFSDFYVYLEEVFNIIHDAVVLLYPILEVEKFIY